MFSPVELLCTPVDAPTTPRCLQVGPSNIHAQQTPLSQSRSPPISVTGSLRSVVPLSLPAVEYREKKSWEKFLRRSQILRSDSWDMTALGRAWLPRENLLGFVISHEISPRTFLLGPSAIHVITFFSRQLPLIVSAMKTPASGSRILLHSYREYSLGASVTDAPTSEPNLFLTLASIKL